MKNPTFIEQFNKITRAYMNNELDPMSPCACFVGNMLNNERGWEGLRSCSMIEQALTGKGTLMRDHSGFQTALNCIKYEANDFYSPQEIIDLEANFLWRISMSGGNLFTENIIDKEKMEHALFIAMQSTLEMLKKIHESKGEVVDGYNFTKRELKTA